ncbi:MAG: hypothetical protein K9W44_14890 [Candidatus Lokiarchaeota archaeon]|nr:hypothetical protein [Candidatus Harpocratesius repetitus]
MAQEISPEFKEKLFNWLKKQRIINMDIKILITAFTHPSYKGVFPEVEDYERLEFLGDAVLDLVSAEDLIKHSSANEGVLTERRKQLVNNENLSQIFDRLKISSFIRTAPHYKPSIKDKANFIEAFFGALFLEHRYEYCVIVWRQFQEKMGKIKKKIYHAPLSPEDEQNKEELKQFYRSIGLTPKNAKSMLQELNQKQGLDLPNYELIEHFGPDHNPTFRVKVSGIFFTGPPKWTRSAIGEGKSKKIAEIRAAEKLCDQIYLDYIPFD